MVRTTLGLVMVDWTRTDEDPEPEADLDDMKVEWEGDAVGVVGPCAPVLDALNPGTLPEAVGRTVELDGTSVAVTGQTVVERATTTVVTSPTLQSDADADAAVGQAVIVEEWVVKIVLVVMGTVEFCSREVLPMPEPDAACEVVTATAAVSDVAVVSTGTGFVSVGRAELSVASEAVTGQIVVSTTTTTVVSPASLTVVEVPVTKLVVCVCVGVGFGSSPSMASTMLPRKSGECAATLPAEAKAIAAPSFLSEDGAMSMAKKRK